MLIVLRQDNAMWIILAYLVRRFKQMKINWNFLTNAEREMRRRWETSKNNFLNHLKLFLNFLAYLTLRKRKERETDRLQTRRNRAENLFSLKYSSKKSPVTSAVGNCSLRIRDSIFHRKNHFWQTQWIDFDGKKI